MPCRFYRQVTYNEQLQAYVFIDTNARVPAEGSMYVIFHEPTKRYSSFDIDDSSPNRTVRLL